MSHLFVAFFNLCWDCGVNDNTTRHDGQKENLRKTESEWWRNQTRDRAGEWKCQSLFFKLFLLFSNQYWTTTVPHSKALFYLRDRQSLSIPLWTVAPDYKTQIQQKRTIPLFSARHPKDGMVPHRPKSGRVEFCCAISSACSCFVSFPSNVLFFPPFASSLNFTVCLRTCRLVKWAKKKQTTKNKNKTRH